MSDAHEDPGARLFRAALPGRPSGLTPPPVGLPAVLAPGRAWLELAIVAAAIAILVPLSGTVALASAVFARRAGNSRSLAAIAAALWCTVLGIGLRGALGMAVAP